MTVESVYIVQRAEGVEKEAFASLESLASALGVFSIELVRFVSSGGESDGKPLPVKAKPGPKPKPRDEKPQTGKKRGRPKKNPDVEPVPEPEPIATLPGGTPIDHDPVVDVPELEEEESLLP